MQIKFKKHVITAILLWSGIAVFSQTSTNLVGFRNEIGIDVANIVTFLSKKNESCLINYKHHFSEKHALRTGLNLELSSSKDGYNAFKLKGGYQYNFPISDRWRLYSGVDALLRYQSNNFQPNRSIRYGICPVVGFSFFLDKHFTVSTEISLNFFYTDYQNSASYSPEDNANIWDIHLGSVGMLVVSYLF